MLVPQANRVSLQQTADTEVILSHQFAPKVVDIAIETRRDSEDIDLRRVLQTFLKGINKGRPIFTVGI